MVRVISLNQSNPVNVSPSTETRDHDKLANRDAVNQHPIRAITGLREALLDASNHIANKENPHEVTKAQVGLGNVDNTSDLNKPISTATQSALDLKVNTADLGNAELDIQKNGVSVGKFTANASTDKVINIVVPTKASDVNALPDTTKYGASLVMSINSSTFVVTAQLKDQDGGNLGSAQTIDLPLESVVVNGSYDSTNKKIVLTLENGNTIDIPVGDLIAGLQSEITVDNKLNSDLVDDSGQTNKFVTASEKAQISTNASNITALQTDKADKSTTYTKTEVDTIASGKANVGLDNLNADGQMIIDTQNGTISNCILEIPQNIKISISNNVITLASGSVVALTGYNTYTTRTTTANITKDSWVSSWYNKTVLLYIGSTGTWFDFKEVSKVGSGSSLPADNTNFDDFYLTTDYSWYGWENGTWSKKNFSYPLAIVNVDSSGVASFAKDSNGNDMIFNGAGFIGHHAFVYPNVKALIPNEFNEDESLKSASVTTNALRIIELSNNVNAQWVSNDGFRVYYLELEEPPSNPKSYLNYYIKNQNRLMVYDGNSWGARDRTMLIVYSSMNNIVTNFTIRQPYEGARNLLTDDIEKEVATKQADVTTLTGYDSTQTQTLKNINGVLTWVTD